MQATARIFQAGFGKHDITPGQPLLQSGFIARTRPAEGVHDALYARALALCDGDTQVLVITLDLIGVDAELTDRIRTRIARTSQVNSANVAVLATHTHGAPAVLGRSQLGKVDASYLDQVVTSAAQAAATALDRLETCEVRFATGSQHGLASNRRNPAGPVDPAVEVIRFDADGRCLGLLVSHACHPVVLGPDNLLLTRDYPGVVIDTLEACYPGATVMFATGAAGQLNTGHSAYDSWQAAPAARRTFAEATRLGRLLAGTALQASEAALKLPAAPATPLQVTRELVTIETLPDDAKPAQQPTSVTVELQALGFCGQALALFPGEVFVEYGLRVKERFPERVITLAYANAAPGYLPTRAALTEGGYEVADAHRFYGLNGPFGPDTEDALVAAMIRGVSRVLPAEELLQSAGWLDIQVNGFAGIDFNSGSTTPAEFEQARQALRAEGVTRFLPTVITASPDHLLECLARIDEACHASPELERAMPGIHLEGPFISPADGARGAHPLDCVLPPDLELFERLQAAAGGRILLVTLAPEQPGSIDFIRELVGRGVRIAIGHSLADTAQLAAAAAAGASLSTHLGNGLPGQLARHPNPLWDQLADDRLAASAIFDGHHLPDSIMRVLQRAKPGRLILTSDAVALAGLKPGVYEGQVGGKVELHASGRLTMYGSEYLAGSASSLLDGVNTALRVMELPLTEILKFVTAVPERVLGLPPAGEQLLLRVTHGADGSRRVAVEQMSGQAPRPQKEAHSSR